jgi:hypothetical protein
MSGRSWSLSDQNSRLIAGEGAVAGAARGEASAVAAAVELARALGLRVERPAVLHRGSNLLVELAPAPVVARVTVAPTATVRPGSAWLRREVAVARFLADAGAPVVAPTDLVDPGPHLHDGHAVSLWPLLRPLAGPPDGYVAGRALRACHEALAAFDGAAAGLEPWALLSEARALVERLAAGPPAPPAAAPRAALRAAAPPAGDGAALTPADADVLRATGARVTRRVEALGLPLQAVHGDAHLRNVVVTDGGLLWSDWEDAFLGPTGWDVACFYAFLPPFADADPALVGQTYRGYGDFLHTDVLRALVAARRFQALVWGVVLQRGRPGRAAWVRERLDELRRRANAATEKL